jgi:ribose/xylose/arabinose/galactoside ABC-type transport system permease subunit
MRSSSNPSSVFGRYRNELGLLFALVVVIGVTFFFSASYRQMPAENARLILRDASMLGVFALGAAIVIISGGIDLSAGSVIAFSGTLFCGSIVMLVPRTERGQPITNEVDLWIVLVAAGVALCAALLVGSFHAWLITVIELPPFVATLASLVGLRSLARLLSSRMAGSEAITINDSRLRSIGSDAWWVPVTLWVLLAVAFWLMMNRTVVGRYLYAMGGNEQAARLSGIRTERLKWLAYCIGSFTAGISGILYASYVGSVEASNAGMGYELHAIASSVVGGCSLAGGIGTIPGVMLGALFLRVVVDSVQKLAVTDADRIEGLVVGVLVVLAVAVNTLRFQGGTRKKFFPGWLGVVNVLILGLLCGTIVGVVVGDAHRLSYGLTSGSLVSLLMAGVAFWERRNTAVLKG